MAIYTNPVMGNFDLPDLDYRGVRQLPATCPAFRYQQSPHNRN